MMVCESCGMPLDKATTSRRSIQYCVYCQDQKTGELATRKQVRDGSIEAMMRLFSKTRQEAEDVVDKTMATLPRWQRESKELKADK